MSKVLTTVAEVLAVLKDVRSVMVTVWGVGVWWIHRRADRQRRQREAEMNRRTSESLARFIRQRRAAQAARERDDPTLG